MADDQIDPDDFSDESNHGGDYDDDSRILKQKSHDQDEQHAQKVNGKIDSLRAKVKELELELKKEKRRYEKTNEKLLELTNSPPKTVSFKGIITELISTCSKLAINHSVLLGPDVSESDIISVLKSMKTLAPAVEQLRPNTSSSTKSAVGNETLLNRIKSLEDELRLALGAAEDIKALKAKLLLMVERLRSEKETRDRQAFELKTSRKKLTILTDHIEKLMNHLKHEAAAKIRALETLRDQEKVTLNANQKCLKLIKQGVAKDRLIMELREGGKILEDQLRLMDEKYLELRTKLDFARDSSEKRIKKAEKVAGDLRVKFALAGNTRPLDTMPLPMPVQVQTPSVGLGEASFSTSDFGDGFSFYSESVTKSAVTKKSEKSSKAKSGSREKAFATDAQKDEEVQRLLEKMRLKNGSSNNWNEQKARALTESR